MIIYKATNKTNGKVYIGMTNRALYKRKKEHLSSAKKGSKTMFHRSLIKHGFDSFDWEIVDTSKTLSLLVKKESFWIEKTNSVDNKFGYNTRKGHSNKIDTSCLDESSIKLDETLFVTRKDRTVRLDIDLYQNIKLLAVKQGRNANDIIEEGMKAMLIKYREIEDTKKDLNN